MLTGAADLGLELVVNSAVDVSQFSFDDDEVTLREAVYLANSTPELSQISFIPLLGGSAIQLIEPLEITTAVRVETPRLITLLTPKEDQPAFHIAPDGDLEMTGLFVTIETVDWNAYPDMVLIPELFVRQGEVVTNGMIEATRSGAIFELGDRVAGPVTPLPQDPGPLFDTRGRDLRFDQPAPITVRWTQNASVRLVAHDLETPSDQLHFSVVNVTGPEPLANDYQLRGSLFEFHPRHDRPLGTWLFHLRVTDSDGHFRDRTLSATIVGFNKQRPHPGTSTNHNGQYSDLYFDYVNNQPKIPIVEPGLNRDTPEKVIQFQGYDSQTAPENLMYGGDVSATGELRFDVDHYAGQHHKFNVAIFDDGANAMSIRNTISNYHLIVDKWVRDGYETSGTTTVIVNPDGSITTIPPTLHGVGDLLVNAPGVAFDSVDRVNWTGTASVEIQPRVRFAAYGVYELDGLFGAGNLDEFAPENRPQFSIISLKEGLNGTVISDPTSVPNGPIEDFDSDTGWFRYRPPTGLDGLVEIKYSFEYPIFKYDGDGMAPFDAMVERRTSEIATIYVNVGNPIRVDLLGGGLSEQNEQVGLGLVVHSNNDDDNNNSVADYRELNGTQPLENDVLTEIQVRVELTRDDVNRDDYFGYFTIHTLDSDPRNIRLWADPQKTREIFPAVVSSVANLETGQHYSLDELQNLNASNVIYVEGLSPGRDNLSLFVDATDRGFANITTDGWISQPASGWAFGSAAEDGISVTTFNFDLNIDSNNNNKFDRPEGSAWEEKLEDHEYGLGKLVLQSSDPMGQTTPGLALLFTPTVIRVGKDLNDVNNNLRIRIDFDPNSGSAGEIQVWTRNKPVPRIDLDVAAGGHRITPGNSYSLTQLGYNPQTGEFLLYLDGKRVSSRHTLNDVETRQRGNVSFDATAVWTQNGQETDLATDTVKYIVVHGETFYRDLQGRQEVRSALAARGVYGINDTPSDMPDFSLKRLTDDELAEIGVKDEIKNLLFNETNPNPVAGFKAALYQDYTAVQDKTYILSFAGTDDLDDWINNAWQGGGWDSPQYVSAMEIGDGLRQMQLFVDPNLRFTIAGHSLGGGLASAAYSVSGRETYTFNASGLNIKTLYARDARGRVVYDALGNPVEKYVGSLARFNNAVPFVQARYVDFDILSSVQDAVPFMPNALGTRIEMDGPYDFEINLSRVAILASIAALPIGGAVTGHLSNLAGYYYMGLAHLNDAVLYGLLVDFWTGKDLLGYDF